MPFLIAAKQSEIGELFELTRMADLMQVVAELVHELQRERGLTNIVLASAGRHRVPQRLEQIVRTDLAELRVDEHLQRLDLQNGPAPALAQGSALYARLAQAQQAQAALPALRAAAQRQGLSVQRATAAYVRIVAAWLGVVFEAADIAADADVSRMLVSLFHLMQAKEQAGQERAAGSALFAAGRVTAGERLKLKDFADAQDTSLAGFVEFAAKSAVQVWQSPPVEHAWRQRDRLRRMLMADSEHGALNPALSSDWFDACTDCMEHLRAAQDALISELRAVCRRKCAELEAELSGLLRLLGSAAASLSSEQALALLEAPHRDDPQAAPAAVEVMALVRTQAQRLQRVSAELEAARAALQDRKSIERAKGLLMSRSGMSEEDAYAALRHWAMERGQRLVDAAQELLRRTN